MNGNYVGTTPTTFSTKRDSQIALTFRLQGYADKNMIVGREFNPIAILNLLNIVCWAVDIATGAVFRLNPEIVFVTMEPLGGWAPPGPAAGPTPYAPYPPAYPAPMPYPAPAPYAPSPGPPPGYPAPPAPRPAPVPPPGYPPPPPAPPPPARPAPGPAGGTAPPTALPRATQ